MKERQKSVDALFLAETLASRLCHDLSGEVNALAGAVEEMRDSACPNRDAIELANDACEALVRRLRLARAAWGGLGGPMGREEWRTIVDFMPRRGVTLALDGVSEVGFFAPAAARLTLNTAQTRRDVLFECAFGGSLYRFRGHVVLPVALYFVQLDIPYGGIL